MRANEFIPHDTSVDEGWKEIAAAGALATSLALGGNQLIDKSTSTEPPAAADQIANITQQPSAAATKLAKPRTPTSKETTLKHEATKAGIRGIELAQFMAQVQHESADFAHMKEIGGSLDFRKYDPKYSPRTAKILGNTKPGDGALYKGRGFIQITGRDNYRMAGAALNLPLEKNPELAARPDVAAKIAVWYWNTRVKPFVQNFNDTAAVTKKINPAMRGLDDRHAKFQDYKNVI